MGHVMVGNGGLCDVEFCRWRFGDLGLGGIGDEMERKEVLLWITEDI